MNRLRRIFFLDGPRGSDTADWIGVVRELYYALLWALVCAVVVIVVNHLGATR